MVLIKKDYGDPNGYVQIPAVVVATGLGTIPAHTKVAYIQPIGGDVRWRDDGVDPTAAVGMSLPDGSVMEYVGKLSDLKFIDNGGAAKINAIYYK